MDNIKQLETIQIWEKIRATAGSQNFFVSLISVFLFALDINNLGINVSAEQILEAIQSGESNAIILIIVNLVNPILKLINRTAEWSWDFLKSQNFITQALTVLLLGATYFIGIQFPEGAATEVVGAFGTGAITAILAAVVINIVNPIIHFFDMDKPVDDQPVYDEPDKKIS